MFLLKGIPLPRQRMLLHEILEGPNFGNHRIPPNIAGETSPPSTTPSGKHCGKRAALLFNPREAPFVNSGFLRRSFETTARQIEVEPIMAPVHDTGEIKAAIKSLARTQSGGVVVMADGFMLGKRALIIESVARHHLPTIYPYAFLAAQGGLVTYGADVVDITRRPPDYVDRILKGANPANLPVQAPTKFELVINLKTAKALGLTVPPTLLVRAQRVIE
jgi:putative ABC transport system substrate-binding protein